MTKFTTGNKLAVYSLYVVSCHNGKQKKAQTIGENLLMPVMKEIKIMIVEKENKKLNSVSLSNSTVERRKADMSDDVLEKIPTHVRESQFYSIHKMNAQILQVCPSYKSLFATLTMLCYFGKY